jgi:hypothetical protein
MPAHGVAGFAIELRTLPCVYNDVLDGHQFRRLRALAREMDRQS